MPQNSWRRSPKVLIAVAAAVVVAGAGAGLALIRNPPGGAAAASATTSTANGPAPDQPCPLTGAPAGSQGVPGRPALAVKVDNYPDARPQAGLNNADIVYEEPVEGGITRLVAVFQCHDANLIGPIRSAREPDVAIVDQLSDPIFVHVGGIDPVLSLISSASDHNLDLYADGTIIQHVPGRSAPYNTYISSSAAWSKYPNLTSPPTPVFTFSATPPAGVATHTVHIDFSPTNDNTWSWDPSSNTWKLSIGGVPARNADGAQIGVTNLVIQTVRVSYGPWLENDLGGYEVQVNATSGGTAEVLRNGVSVAGTWQRSFLNQAPQFDTADGSSIPLAPGQTWVEMVPSDISVSAS